MLGSHEDSEQTSGDKATGGAPLALLERKEMSAGRGFVFPSPAGCKHMGRESIEKVYRVTLELDGGRNAQADWKGKARTNGTQPESHRSILLLY